MNGFVTPQYLRVWANWCAVHGLRAELRDALHDAASEIERLQLAVNGKVNGNLMRAETNNEVIP